MKEDRSVRNKWLFHIFEYFSTFGGSTESIVYLDLLEMCRLASITSNKSSHSSIINEDDFESLYDETANFKRKDADFLALDKNGL